MRKEVPSSSSTSTREPIGGGKAKSAARPWSSSDRDMADFTYRWSALDSPTAGLRQVFGMPFG